MRTSLFLKSILGSSERFAQYVLSGERRPGGEKARRLARALGVPLEAVLFPEEYGLDMESRLRTVMLEAGLACRHKEERYAATASGEAPHAASATPLEAGEGGNHACA